MSAPAALRYDGRLPAALQIRLDSGASATLSMMPAPCGDGEGCEPADCGCHGVDRCVLSIADSHGVEIARTYLWAAYGSFDLVPVDLVDGAGDELLVVRILGRSSPPNGHDLRILQVSDGRLIELLEPIQIAGNLSGTPMVCGQWRSRVTIDATEPKPRALLIRNDVIVPDGCRLDEAGRASALRSERRYLLFAQGRYQLRRE